MAARLEAQFGQFAHLRRHLKEKQRESLVSYEEERDRKRITSLLLYPNTEMRSADLRECDDVNHSAILCAQSRRDDVIKGIRTSCQDCHKQICHYFLGFGAKRLPILKYAEAFWRGIWFCSSPYGKSCEKLHQHFA